jgi:small subunit ribosomal protein S16
MGKRRRPFYRIVAMDINAPANGHALAQVGFYDPLTAQVKVDEDTARLWLDRGAVMTPTVKALLRSQGILARWRGLEGRVREDALTRDKPARRRKLAQSRGVEETAEEAADEAVGEADQPQD